MSVSKLKKLVLIAPNDEADNVIRKIISLRCVAFGDFSQKESFELLERKNFEGDIAEAQNEIQKIEGVISALSKHANDLLN